MPDEFKIYIDRLKGGSTHQINTSFHPSFLEIDEKELQFRKPVTIQGEAYLTDDHLVIHLSAATIAEMPCAICNHTTQFPLAVHQFYHTEPLSEISSSVYDFSQVVREALLIELPRTIECNGNCPERESLTPYLRKETRSDKDHFPFANFEQ